MDSTEGKREPESSAAQKEHEEVKNLRWWQRATVYQVLVPSFKDTNDDGRGDLQGVLENLDYFVDLGVDIVWLSPIFESPMFDMGYKQTSQSSDITADADCCVPGMISATTRMSILSMGR